MDEKSTCMYVYTYLRSYVCTYLRMVMTLIIALFRDSTCNSFSMPLSLYDRIM